MNEKGGYDFTPEWEAKLDAKNPKKVDLMPFCEKCGKALKTVDEYHICGSPNIEKRSIEPPKDKSWVKK
jgi:hypothetical protein